MTLEVTLHCCDTCRFDVILARPEKRNALTLAMLDAVADAIDKAAGEGARVVVLRSDTRSAFSAGADLSEWAAFSADAAVQAARRGRAATDRVARAPVPVIAQIDGHCLGGGLELALACDMRVAAATAWFGFPEVALGGAPAWGGIPRLVTAVGESHARTLLLTGTPIDAGRAFDIGLVNACVPASALREHVSGVALAIAACPSQAVARIRMLIEQKRAWEP